MAMTLNYERRLPTYYVVGPVTCTAVVGLFLSLVVNAALLVMAWHDKSFGALAIAAFYGPCVNFGLGVVLSLAAGLWAASRQSGGMIACAAVGLALPLAFVFLDFMLIGGMGLHGC